LAETGVDVLAVGKRPRHDAHTALAAGGINAALGTMDAEDSWQQHAADTIKESYYLADPRTVEIVAKGAAEGIADLERYGMGFAREQDGRISQRFSAHTPSDAPPLPVITPDQRFSAASYNGANSSKSLSWTQSISQTFSRQIIKFLGLTVLISIVAL